MSDHRDTVTIIRARRGKRLAKLIRADGTITDYDSAYRFDLIERPAPTLDAVGGLLHQLMRRADCAIVRGGVIDPTRTVNVRRLAYRDDDTGDEPTLRDVPHRWLALDMEGVGRPDDVPADDLARCAAEAVRRLPGAFHGARCIAQATAGHGIKPGCRVRLWYWLSRPTTGAELGWWLRGKPADPSVFRTVQPIYTAAPVFDRGVRDHLPQRMAALPGAEMVAVPSPNALRPPARPPAPMPKPSDAGANNYAWAALRNAAARIRSADVGHRHDTILREARCLARFISAGLLAAADVMGTLHGAGHDAGKPEDEITLVIAWAIAHPSGASLPENVA
jgi:hypothetical protein